MKYLTILLIFISISVKGQIGWSGSPDFTLTVSGTTYFVIEEPEQQPYPPVFPLVSENMRQQLDLEFPVIPIVYGAWRPTVQERFNSLPLGGGLTGRSQTSWVDFEQTRNGYRGGDLVSTDTRIINVRIVDSNPMQSREGFSGNSINEDVNGDGDMYDIVTYTANNYEGFVPDEDEWIVGGRTGRNDLRVTENLTYYGVHGASSRYSGQQAYYSTITPESLKNQFASFYRSSDARGFILASPRVWLLSNADTIYFYSNIALVNGGSGFTRPSRFNVFLNPDNRSQAYVTGVFSNSRTSVPSASACHGYRSARETTALHSRFNLSNRIKVSVNRGRCSYEYYTVYAYRGTHYNIQTRELWEHELGSESINNTDTDIIDRVEQSYIYDEDLDEEFIVEDWRVIEDRN